MITKIKFKGYKSFRDITELEIKPITVIFGKNSAGKSALVKLPTLIEGALKLDKTMPINYINKSIELGSEHRDLFYKGAIQEELKLTLYDGDSTLETTIINSIDSPIISELTIESKSAAFDKFHFKLGDGTQDQYDIIPNNKIKEHFSLDTYYLGPFRLKPQRVFYIGDLSNNTNTDEFGKETYYQIAKDEELEGKVSEWFYKNFDEWTLYVKKNRPYYEIKIRKSTDWDGINLADVGQGMSQALPIIVKTLSTSIEDTPILKIFEQPELHLHPAAHGNLAELIARSTLNSNDKYLIETHSKNFILRLRTLIARKIICINDLNLYFVDYDNERDCSNLVKIEIDEIGQVDNWPEDIFNESFEEAVQLQSAQNSNKEK